MRDGGRWLGAAVLTIGLYSLLPLGLWGSVIVPFIFYGLLTVSQKLLPYESFLLPQDNDLDAEGGYYKFSDLIRHMVRHKLNALVAGGLFIECLWGLSAFLSPAFAIAAALGLAMSGMTIFAGLQLFCDEKIFPKAAPWVNTLYIGFAAALASGLGIFGATMAASIRSLMVRTAMEVVAVKSAVNTPLALLTTTVGTAAPGLLIALGVVKMTARREVVTGGEGKCGGACTCNAGPL